VSCFTTILVEVRIIKALNHLTEGPILKSLLAMSLPIVFANVLQSAYQLVDAFWVGRIGAEAVAAVSLSFPVMFLMIAFGGGLAIAGTILVAQYKGKGDQAQVDHIAAQTLATMTLISVSVSVVGYVLAPTLMVLMGAQAGVLPGAVAYLQISFLGLVFLFGFFIFQSLMRGIGDVKTPLYIVLGTVLLNLVLDPLFILGYGPIPSFGVAGAALATVGTQGLAAVVGVYLLFSGRYGIHLKPQNLVLDFPLIRKMFWLGFPSSIDQSTRALGLMVMTFLAASYGTLIIAAYGIGSRILSFIIIPALGLSMATSALVGQNIGAGKVDRAEKIAQMSVILAFSVLTFVGILLFVFARPLAAAFIPNDPAVIKQSAAFTRTMALAFGFLGVQQTLSGVFMGSGNTRTSMSITIISLWLLQVPLAYGLSRHTDLAATGIWWAFPISNVVTAFIAWGVYSKGNWKQRKITEEFTPSRIPREANNGETSIEHLNGNVSGDTPSRAIKR